MSTKVYYKIARNSAPCQAFRGIVMVFLHTELLQKNAPVSTLDQNIIPSISKIPLIL